MAWQQKAQVSQGGGAAPLSDIGAVGVEWDGRRGGGRGQERSEAGGEDIGLRNDARRSWVGEAGEELEGREIKISLCLCTVR